MSNFLHEIRSKNLTSQWPSLEVLQERRPPRSSFIRLSRSVSLSVCDFVAKSITLIASQCSMLQ